MSVFDAYAEYYDLLYAGKEYEEEVEYVEQHIQSYTDGAERLLDLGCGTGRHGLAFANRGFEVMGIDQSTRMVEAARARTEGERSVEVTEGDVRSVRLDRTFDIVTALFHVVSYQQTNEDLRRTLDTVRRHLSPDGLFLFDCWYGPTVLTVRPEVRVKRLENDDVRVIRIAEPEMQANANLVNVNYTIFVEDKAQNRVEELKETHTMRYLFAPEVTSLLEDFGFAVRLYEEWRTGREAGFDTWSVMFVAQAT
ncbi:class I SAM-dependent DNA methyltransferase [Salinibacter ruber]|uniref:class I SAM-dependent DNA methyltransferase n=1 Tax=Salinibacter ruber TaxID=146919 RepID=UPI0021691514|nr:class I SAM-dependent methyltransferase [Salinibacter ruber]MCS4054126.1 SAM-dependent methyltransferase [Salinibacter ruber]